MPVIPLVIATMRNGDNQQLFVAKRQDGDGFNTISETPNIERPTQRTVSDALPRGQVVLGQIFTMLVG